MAKIIKAQEMVRGGFTMEDLKSWVERAEKIIQNTEKTPTIIFRMEGGRYPEDTPTEAIMIIDVEYSLGQNKLTFILGN